MPSKRHGLPVLVLAIGLGDSTRAAAQSASSTTAAAEALFQDGRALLLAGKIEEACPKLEESQRLDPATGTLMAVALCREQEGKLASAWAAFADVEARSRVEGRADREHTARDHGWALRPRLSTLFVDVDGTLARAPTLAVSIDGLAIRQGAWKAAIPIDGGSHVVRAVAAGHKPWQTTVVLAREGDHARVSVPSLSRLDLGPAFVEDRISLAVSPRGRSHTPSVVGVLLLGAGGVGLATAAVVAWQAKRDYDAAVVGCRAEGCPADAFARAQNARKRGDLASVIGIASGVVAVGGAALWWWTPSVSLGDKEVAVAAAARF